MRRGGGHEKAQIKLLRQSGALSTLLESGSRVDKGWKDGAARDV